MAKYPGSLATPRLVVKPYDGSTVVTLAVYAPDGTVAANPDVASVGTDTETGGEIFTGASYPINASGAWREQWTVTGTGAGIQHLRYYVSPVPGEGVLAWSPDPWKPADYIPGRTLVPLSTGANTWVMSFNDQTKPTGVQVERLTTDACAWVLAGCGAIAEPLYDMASAVAAIWVASAIEQGYPDTSADESRAAALLQRATAMRTDLAKANEALTGADPVDPGAALLPLYSFPLPDYRDRWI